MKTAGLLLAAAVLPAASAQAATLIMNCLTIMVASKLNPGPPPGWVLPPKGGILGYQNPAPWVAEYVEMFQGNPALRQVIMPVSSTVGYQGGRIIWSFDAAPSNIWLGCHYGTLLLARKLPEAIMTCAAKIDSNGGISINCR
jgi:hypothetical protein